MLYKKTRFYNSPAHILTFSPAEIRLDTTIGIPNKREAVRNMFGTPRLDLVVAYRQNCSFFNTADPKSEEMDWAPFVKFSWDGHKMRIQPFISGLQFDWTIPGGYSLIRDGAPDYAGEDGMKSIIGRNPRSMFGQARNGDLKGIIIEGRLFGRGVTANEQRAIGATLEMESLINLDGGGSSVIYLYDTKLGRAYDGRAIGRILIGYRQFDPKALPMLRKGDRGVYVNLLQRHLNAHYYDSLVEDGIFGRKTQLMVKLFESDGICGPNGWRKILPGGYPK